MSKPIQPRRSSLSRPTQPSSPTAVEPCGDGSHPTRQVSTSSTSETCIHRTSGSVGFEDLIHQAGLVLLHDGTFEGFLTAVFESFRLRLPGARIASASRHVANLLESPREVVTDSVHARRVWSGILERAGKEVAAMVRCAFRANDPGIDDALRHHVRSLFQPCDTSRGRNLLDPHVHAVHEAACRVRHEAHLMLGFVRFQEAPDGSLGAVVSPEHDVVELLGPHFLARLPGQTWIIADQRRGIAVHSDGFRLSVLSCDPAAIPRDARESARLFESGETRWRELWTTFYDSVNIPERRNTRQMTRLLPRKYWDHLPERTRTASGRSP